MITPPVCIAVFVASGIADTNWLPAAVESVRLAAAIYVIPFLLLIYPALAGFGSALEIVLASCQGVVFVVAFAALMSRVAMTGKRVIDVLGLIAVIGLALTPGWLTTLAALALIIGLFIRRRALLDSERVATASDQPSLQAKETH